MKRSSFSNEFLKALLIAVLAGMAIYGVATAMMIGETFRNMPY